jgi:hypothetical protein
MAHKGPSITANYGYALPIRVEADTSLDFTEQQPVVLRIGQRGAPPDDEPALTLELTPISARVATGTIQATALQLEPGEYAYLVSAGAGQERIVVAAGTFVVVCSVLGP